MAMRARALRQGMPWSPGRIVGHRCNDPAELPALLAVNPAEVIRDMLGGMPPG